MELRVSHLWPGESCRVLNHAEHLFHSPNVSPTFLEWKIWIIDDFCETSHEAKKVRLDESRSFLPFLHRPGVLVLC